MKGSGCSSSMHGRQPSSSLASQQMQAQRRLGWHAGPQGTVGRAVGAAVMFCSPACDSVGIHLPALVMRGSRHLPFEPAGNCTSRRQQPPQYMAACCHWDGHAVRVLLVWYCAHGVCDGHQPGTMIARAALGDAAALLAMLLTSCGLRPELHAVHALHQLQAAAAACCLCSGGGGPTCLWQLLGSTGMLCEHPCPISLLLTRTRRCQC